MCAKEGAEKRRGEEREEGVGRECPCEIGVETGRKEEDGGEGGRETGRERK